MVRVSIPNLMTNCILLMLYLLQMQWANNLADSLFIPSWVEASTDGTALYKQFGFYEKKTIGLSEEQRAVAMRRDDRSTPIPGGKAKPEEAE